MVSSRFRRQVKYLGVRKCWNRLTYLLHTSMHRKNTIKVAPTVDDVHISDVESV